MANLSEAYLASMRTMYAAGVSPFTLSVLFQISETEAREILGAEGPNTGRHSPGTYACTMPEEA